MKIGMSVTPTAEPICTNTEAPCIDLVIEARARDLGDGFSVRRVLPSTQRRLVGPFVFYDHMGPAQLAPGTGFDVRPHPHIALATVTYLFEGAIDHKDSVGSEQTIRPGDVNWMVAGSGIAHSERSPADLRPAGPRIHGIQSWVALPTELEEVDPRFEHHPASTIPRVELEGAVLDVVAGTAYGQTSPVGVLSPTLYVHAQLQAGARLRVDDEHAERAVYVVEGAVEIEGRTFGPATMVVLRPGAEVSLTATEATRAMLVGGARLSGERHVWWNFVSTYPERIERAKADWASRNFPAVPGDDEFIPLPTR